MHKNLFSRWCTCQVTDIQTGRKLHTFTEQQRGRATVEKEIDGTVLSHYEDPAVLADQMVRLGYKNAAKILRETLPIDNRARSGHLGEILATECVTEIFPPFEVPIKRLRWLDGRNTAMRGEDFIAVASVANRTRFLKGESKSRNSLSPSTVAKARIALKANRGRPSPHAMGFTMRRLRETGNESLARVFEKYMLVETIGVSDMVHVLFTLCGNDAFASLEADLKNCSTKIEQHAIALRVTGHQDFIGALYRRITPHAPKR